MSTPETHAQGQGSVTEDNGAGPRDTLSVTDNRTGKTYELPITDSTVRATELRQIKVDPDEFGLLSYDPAFMNTASCRSSITYIDGDAGILQHRGYPIEQLCEHSTYLEVAYLLINGRLPKQVELEGWIDEITIHTFVHENVKDFMQGFRYDANPMGMLRRVGRRAVDVLPRREQDQRGARARDPDHPPAREDAHAGGVRVPPQHGPAVRVSGQRPRLREQLPRDDVQNDRAQVRARPAARARARRAVHPPRRPRTERLDERRALGRLAHRSIPTRPSPQASRRCTGRCTAAPTRRRCGCSSGSAAWRTSPRSWRASRPATSG